MEEPTTITISHDLWKLINRDRINPKETMEDVIWRWYNLTSKEKKDDTRRGDNKGIEKCN